MIQFCAIFPSSPDIFVPDLNDPLRGTGDEDVWDEGVPLYVVDRHVVGGKGVEVPDKTNGTYNE